MVAHQSGALLDRPRPASCALCRTIMLYRYTHHAYRYGWRPVRHFAIHHAPWVGAAVVIPATVACILVPGWLAVASPGAVEGGGASLDLVWRTWRRLANQASVSRGRAWWLRSRGRSRWRVRWLLWRRRGRPSSPSSPPPPRAQDGAHSGTGHAGAVRLRCCNADVAATPACATGTDVTSSPRATRARHRRTPRAGAGCRGDRSGARRARAAVGGGDAGWRVREISPSGRALH